MSVAGLECSDLLVKLSAVLDEDAEDVATAERIADMRVDLARLQDEQINLAQKQLDELNAQVEELRNRLESPSLEQFAKQREALIMERAQEEVRLQELQAQVGQLEAQLAEQKALSDSLLEQYDSLAARSRTRVPELKRFVHLYTRVAPIEWDMKSADIKGSIHHRKARQIENFHLRSEDHLSRVQIADFFWESLEKKL